MVFLVLELSKEFFTNIVILCINMNFYLNVNVFLSICNASAAREVFPQAAHPVNFIKRVIRSTIGGSMPKPSP